MTKINNIKSRRKKWTDALRDGTYKQGRHELQNNDGEFCCLGVACAVFSKTLKLKVEKGDYGEIKYDGDQHKPPVKLMKYLELSKNLVQLLMTLNDNDKLSFDRIATVIENLEIVTDETKPSK